MKKIPLTQNKFAIIDDSDYKMISKHRWCAHKEGNCYYAGTNIKLSSGQKRFRTMHRFILPSTYNLVVDHIDCNGLNNCRSNLRLISRGLNAGRQRVQKKKGKSSKYKGVSFYKSRNKWRSAITKNDKCKHLGYFKTENDAAHAYNEMANKFFGKYAILNEIK